jgi:hypothetical protein
MPVVKSLALGLDLGPQRKNAHARVVGVDDVGAGCQLHEQPIDRVDAVGEHLAALEEHGCRHGHT